MARAGVLVFLSSGLAGCGETRGDAEPDGSGGQRAAAGRGNEGGVAGPDHGGGGTAGRDGGAGSEPVGGEPGGSSSAGMTGLGGAAGAGSGDGARVLVGCQAEPLDLGEVTDAQTAHPQIVWNGAEFAVSWVSPQGYQIRITNGRTIRNALTLPAMPENASPQLLWTGSDFKLYYALEDSIYADTLSRSGTLAVLDSELVGVARGASWERGFRAVLTEPDHVTVLVHAAMFANGSKIETTINGVGAAGWNGEYFLYSNVLGHGAWTLYALNPDGSRPPAALSAEWPGVLGTGRAGGSAFASSASTGRHAVVLASNGMLTFALEGAPAWEREILEPEADVSMLWDGENYVVLLADGGLVRGAPNRDLALAAFTKDGAWLSDTDTLTTVSEHPADDRFPVGVATALGEFGMAWIRGGDLLVQTCALTTR